MGGFQEDAAPALAALAAVVVRGKRSKRRRVGAPTVIAAAAESAATTEEEDATSRCSGADEAEEEEDMALCLMLLSRGGGGPATAAVKEKEAKFRSRRPAADGSATGEFVYECKTCSKCFPSFQALGGHRTSHKKPRLMPPLPTTTTMEVQKKPPPPPVETPRQEAETPMSSSSSKQPRVHECSICGAEFASGQALGGHMRRHRPLLPASKEKSLLELDLNMPAPCDDAAFAFAVNERSPALLFPSPASALVHCQY